MRNPEHNKRYPQHDIPGTFSERARAIPNDVAFFRSTAPNARLIHRLKVLVTFAFGECDLHNYRFVALCGHVTCGRRNDYVGCCSQVSSTCLPGFEIVAPKDVEFMCGRCHAAARKPRIRVHTFAAKPLPIGRAA